jgi:hypothetical protein
VVKLIVKLFDILKRRTISDNDDSMDASDTEQLLAQLAQDIELEEVDIEQVVREGLILGDTESDDEEDDGDAAGSSPEGDAEQGQNGDAFTDFEEMDGIDGIIDNATFMSSEDRERFNKSIAPVRLVIVKVI